MLGTGAAALAGTVALAGSNPAQAQAVTRLKIQTAVPTASIYFELMKHFADRVDKMSNGRLKLEILPDGAVVNAFEILDAVDKGVVDGGFAWTHYWSGKNTAAALFSRVSGIACWNGSQIEGRFLFRKSEFYVCEAAMLRSSKSERRVGRCS